ncbi:MAG: hypothetical protein E7069_04475 [Bacteroidales bacterium]|nr:hypothetical protein [Bacteroidales bacterium]
MDIRSKIVGVIRKAIGVAKKISQINYRQVFNLVRYRLRLFYNKARQNALRAIDTFTILAALWSILNIIFQVGFSASPELQDSLFDINKGCVIFFGIVMVLKLVDSLSAISDTRFSPYLLIYPIITWAYIYSMTATNISPQIQSFLNHKYVLSFVLLILSVNEMSRLGLSLLGRRTNPTIMFVGSFIVFIVIGTALLLLPRSHDGTLTFFDALFTSTSSVCVSGLSVIDISQHLTQFGQIVVLGLVQVGGIGVMTFTCFFALSITRGSMQNHLVIKDLVSADSMSSILMTLIRIMYVTFIIEAVCTWLLYNQFSVQMPTCDSREILFVSAFHAISAFCNAGISCLPDGMCNVAIVDCRAIQWIVAFTVIFGGMGFPMQTSVINWVKYKIRSVINTILHRNSQARYRSHLINANAKLAVYTHLILVGVGIIIFLFTENQFTQAGDSFFDRLTKSMFMSVSARTVGYNIVPIEALSPISLTFTIMLMWIGCAPMSTGGGIKVTTFAICMLNIRNVLTGRDNIEIFGRRIAPQSIRKAFAIAIVTLAFIGFVTIALKICAPEIRISHLLLEASSAICTAGISLGVTSNLNTAGRIIIMLSMFIGRIGVMAFLLCFFSPKKKLRYSYPQEEIMV